MIALVQVAVSSRNEVQSQKTIYRNMNQRKRKNVRRNNFMTKSSRKDVPDARIDRGAS